MDEFDLELQAAYDRLKIPIETLNEDIEREKYRLRNRVELWRLGDENIEQQILNKIDAIGSAYQIQDVLALMFHFEPPPNDPQKQVAYRKKHKTF